ncbi:MAG: hypothetical protein ACRCS3_04250 [Paracoccaceae bacterium]
MTVFIAQAPVAPFAARIEPVTPSAFALRASQTVAALPEKGVQSTLADDRPFAMNPANLPKSKTLDPFPDLRFVDPLPDLPKMELPQAAGAYVGALSIFRSEKAR